MGDDAYDEAENAEFDTVGHPEAVVEVAAVEAGACPYSLLLAGRILLRIEEVVVSPPARVARSRVPAQGWCQQDRGSTYVGTWDRSDVPQLLPCARIR